MPNLTYGQHNRLRSTLRELAVQIEDLSRLLAPGDSLSKILPIEQIPQESECAKALDTLQDLRAALLEMAREFDIQLDPVLLRHRLQTSGTYMKTVIKNAGPDVMRGYGELKDEDRQLLNEHVEKIAQIVSKL